MKKKIFIPIILILSLVFLTNNIYKFSYAPDIGNVDRSEQVIVNTDNDNFEIQLSQKEQVQSSDEKPKSFYNLVKIGDIDASIKIELKYATLNNFTNVKVYQYAVCLLRQETAIKLSKVNSELDKLGYTIKIWDAYRPLSVQRIFWDIVGDNRYVAPPGTGSVHNRGGAVDVTLVDKAGNELTMPSAFDDFSQKAWRSNTNVNEQQKNNLEILTNAMTSNGFKTIETEWWHYEDKESNNFPVLDVAFENFINLDSDKFGFEDKIDDNNINQVLWVYKDTENENNYLLKGFEKREGKWEERFGKINAFVGKNGFTTTKKEGDGKTPVGIYSLSQAYGSETNPGTTLRYYKFGKNDFWVDDVDSGLYNTFQKGPSNGRWKSAEDLYKIGYAYKYFIVIDYNTKNIIKGNGSAIFLHISKGNPTSGCIAISEDYLVKVIDWLDPNKNPHIIIGE